MNQIREAIRETLISEIGNTTEAYSYSIESHEISSLDEKIHVSIRFGFETEFNTPYRVIFECIEAYSEQLIGVSFSANGSFEDTVDEGSMFRVMATVMKICKHVWSRRVHYLGSEFFEKDDVYGFRFSPNLKKRGRVARERQRTKLYRAFIHRQFPSATIRTSREWVKVYV